MKEQIASWLRDMCAGKDWYHSVGFDQYGRAVVYVKYMNEEVLRFVPDTTEDGKQVMCHFAASALATKDQFFSKPQETNGLTALAQATTSSILKQVNMTPTTLSSDEEEERQLELSVRALTDELDRLERMCGSNILQDIFYEIHDGRNAVTNLSAKFPEVRQRVQALYDKYGFDIIYEELDG